MNGITFEWTDGLFGLALSGPDNEGYSTLYFHPLTGTHEFSVNTKFLRDEALASKSFHEYKILGSRGPKGQSSVSFFDEKSGVLFYALVNLNAVACWKSANPSYTMESQGRVYMNNITMNFPNDLKVDNKGNLWVLSNRLPKFMYESLDPQDFNFRILTAPVKEAIKGTACDAKLVVNPEIASKIKPTNKETPRASSANTIKFNAFVFLVLSLLWRH